MAVDGLIGSHGETVATNVMVSVTESDKLNFTQTKMDVNLNSRLAQQVIWELIPPDVTHFVIMVELQIHIHVPVLPDSTADAVNSVSFC